MSQTKIRNVCLPVIFEFFLHCCLLSVVCSASAYIIQNYPNIIGFLILKTLCSGRSKKLPYVWQKCHKNNNKRHLCLEKQSFIKHSQNMCLILIHTFWYIDMLDCICCNSYTIITKFGSQISSIRAEWLSSEIL